MKNKALIRVVLYAAIFAWPAVEGYRYYTVRRQLVASESSLKVVTQQVAQTRTKAQFAKADSEAKP